MGPVESKRGLFLLFCSTHNAQSWRHVGGRLSQTAHNPKSSGKHQRRSILCPEGIFPLCPQAIFPPFPAWARSVNLPGN
jgi:hypothetical protein